MKKFLTLAISLMIVSLTFALEPAMVKKAAHSLQRVMNADQVSKLMETKKAEQARLEAANEFSVARGAQVNNQQAGFAQLTINKLNVNAKNLRTVDFATIANSRRNVAPKSATEPTVDAHGIITAAPTSATVKYYKRAGTAYFVSGGQMAFGAQSGYAELCEMPNGDVYLKNPISRYTQNSYVKGTKDGNKLVFATKQPLAYSDEYSATISMRWGVIDVEGNIDVVDSHATSFTYAIDGDVLTLEGTQAFDETADAYFMGSFWDDDDSSTGYGDAESVLTYDPTYNPTPKEPVVPPTGMTTETWYVNGNTYSSTPEKIENREVKVGFAGTDVYVQGLFSNFPNAWIKGSVSGITVTFPALQYIGVYGAYDIYFIGATSGTIEDGKAENSTANKTITLKNIFFANAADDRVYYLEGVDAGAVISAEKKEPGVIEVVVGKASLPYVNTFDTATEVAEVAIVDANEDQKTFSNQSKAMRYAYNSSKNADDYVVMPGLDLEAGKKYVLKADVKAQAGTYAERYEIVYAKDDLKLSSFNNVLVAAEEVDYTDYKTKEVEFTPTEAGTYYFAVHCVSDKDKYYFWFDNFSFEAPSATKPGKVTDLTITPGAEGAKTASVSFKMPTATAAGVDYETGKDLYYIVKHNGVEFAHEYAKAGASVTVNDDGSVEGLVDGNNEFSVVVVDGSDVGDATTASAFLGLDKPGEVEDLAITDLGSNTLKLGWNAPSKGANGGYQGELTYNVYDNEMMSFFGMEFPVAKDLIATTDQTETTLTYATEEGAQRYEYFHVSAKNSVNEGYTTYNTVLVGAPYELPFHETFAGGALSYWWGVNYSDDIYNADGGLGLADGSVVFNAPVAGWIELYSGKIAVPASAESVGVSFKAVGAGTLKTYANVDGVDHLLGTETLSASESMVRYSLSEYAGKNVKFTFRGEFEEAAQAAMTDIIVMNFVDHDLAIKLIAPSTVEAGTKAVISATVSNNGLQNVAAGAYSVKFTAGDQALALFSGDQETMDIPSMGSCEFTTSLEPTIFDQLGALQVVAQVEYAADQDLTNNEDAVEVTIKAPAAQAPVAVAADCTESGVEVAITLPSSFVKTVTESFDDIDAALLPIAYDHNGDNLKFNDLTAHDGDKGMTYGWQNLEWPLAGEKFAFAVSDLARFNHPDALERGNAALFISNEDKKNDDYMISPMLPGVAQTISFKAAEITDNYGPESIEILVSSTDDAIESFSILATEDVDSEDFSEFEYNLPEGTKYFAIHYVSNDVFCLFVDDLAYQMGGEPTAVNIYLDQQLVETVPYQVESHANVAPKATIVGDTVTTTLTGVAAGEHTVSATLVFDGLESAAVSTTFTATGVESVKVTLGTNGEIYNLNGARVSAKNANGGVYIINGQKSVVK